MNKFEKPEDMSAEQYAYALALAMFETAKDAANVEIKALYDAIDLNQTEAEFDRHLEFAAPEQTKIQDKYRLDELLRLLRQAEDAMIQWAHAKTAESPMGKQKPEVLQAFTHPRARKPPFREQLVALCFKGKFPVTPEVIADKVRRKVSKMEQAVKS